MTATTASHSARRRVQMGKNRRQDRLQQRRQQPSTSAAGSTARPAPKPMAAWRHTLQQWGGPWVLGVGIAVLAFVGWLAWENRPIAVSSDGLMGEEVTYTSSSHVTSRSELQIQPGVPPAGGPHFVDPLPGGVYDQPVDDGRVIHSLEHGLIWISYRPGAISEADLKAVTEIAKERTRDVVLSPRPDNKEALTVVSWGRRLALKADDTKTLKEFISTNLNRSPEPGVR
ncbi:MAG: DUF3105 domain-containing protein [Chloroflexi bacterium]|nr:DUF3105 domain-containing protein [Chloroflexota bacterium]